MDAITMLTLLLLQLLAPGLQASQVAVGVAVHSKQAGHITTAAHRIQPAPAAARAASVRTTAISAAPRPAGTGQLTADAQTEQDISLHLGLLNIDIDDSQPTAAKPAVHAAAAVVKPPAYVEQRVTASKLDWLEANHPKMIAANTATQQAQSPVAAAAKSTQSTRHVAVAKPAASPAAASITAPAAARMSLLGPLSVVQKVASTVGDFLGGLFGIRVNTSQPAPAPVTQIADAVPKPPRPAVAAAPKPTVKTTAVKPATAAVLQPAQHAVAAVPKHTVTPTASKSAIAAVTKHTVKPAASKPAAAAVLKPAIKPAAPKPATAAVPKPATEPKASKPATAVVPKPTIKPTASKPAAAAVPKHTVKHTTSKPAAAAVLKPPGVQAAMCEWRPDFSSCVIGRKYLLAINWTPQSYASKLVSAAAARDQACSAYTTADDCLKKSSPDLLCDWDMGGTVGWDQGCHSTYLSEWTAFAELASNVGGVGAARAMGHAGSLTCPGSLAQKTLGCSNLYPLDHQGNWAPNYCQQGVGCTYNGATHSCATSPSMEALVASLQPKIVGTCSAACYLRMLNKCGEANKQPVATRAAWCQKQQGCQWDSRRCQVDVWLSDLDKWGEQASYISTKCAQQKSESQCAAAGAKGVLPVVPGRARQFLRVPINHGSDSVKCPV